MLTIETDIRGITGVAEQRWARGNHLIVDYCKAAIPQ
jgi:hypothetical protein